jgi:uncharacterized membrane protein
MIELETLGSYANARAMNERGQVVGVAGTELGDARAVLWTLVDN